MINKPVKTNAIKWGILTFLILRISTILIVEVLARFPIEIKPTFKDATQGYYELYNSNEFGAEFLAPWFRWDTLHYLRIAKEGYGTDPSKIAWPPLYPFLIKIFSYVIKPPILSAIILSNIFLLVVLYELYLFSFELFDENVAKKSTIYLIFFPSAFFLVAGFSESLFLLLSIMCFRQIKKENWKWAGMLSALATLCRVQGLLLMVPMGIRLIGVKRKKGINPAHFTSLAIAPFTYGLFSVYCKFGLNQTWPWKSLLNNWDLHFGFPWEGIIGNITSLFGRELTYQFSLPIIQIVNLITVALAIFLLMKFWKKIPLWINIYSVFCLILFLSKVDNQSILISTVRYLVSLFPIFIGLAAALKSKLSRIVYIAVSFVFQTILLTLFYFWAWVA